MWCGIIFYDTTGRYVWVPVGLTLGAVLRKILLCELHFWGKVPPVCFWLHPCAFKTIPETKGRSQRALLTPLLLTRFSSVLKIPRGTCLFCWLLLFLCLFFFPKSVQNIYLYEENAFICLRGIWFAYSTAVHRNSCCWLEQHSSVCKAKRFYKQISPLCLLVSLPNLNFPGAEWSSLREKTICALLMLRGIKLCRWGLILVFPLSCFSAGVGFVAVPGKLAEAAGPCRITLIRDWSDSLLPFSCRNICLFCVWISVCQRNTIYPADSDNKNVVWCISHKIKGTAFQPLPLAGLILKAKLGDAEK